MLVSVFSLFVKLEEHSILLPFLRLQMFFDLNLTQASSVVAFKSIVAYRSGLRINPSVTDEDAEKGLVRTVGEHDQSLEER